MTEDVNNQELRRAYRDLATEVTPAKLDDKVLGMATRETRSRYGVARAWVRPVAWAATIGLSLAIVLEVLQVIPPAPEPEPAAIGETLPEPLIADDAPARPQKESTRREDVVETPAAVTTVRKSAPVNPGGGAAEELGAARAAPQNLPEEPQNLPEEPQNLPEEKEGGSVVLDDADAFAAKDIRILEEAEVQARQRSGDPGISTFAAVATEARTAHCDETARSTAESWYECIEELREAGAAEFADSELAALILAFPDFEVPEKNR